MQHTNLSDLQDAMDEMLWAPNELFVSSNSRHCALFSSKDGAFFFLEGDFSGTPEECEAEVRRIMNTINPRKVVIAE